MNATQRWLDRLSKHLADPKTGEPASDYRMAKSLGMSPQSFSSFRSRGPLGKPSQMNDDVSCRVAELLGINAMIVIADVRSERAREARTKNFWQKAAQLARDKGAAAVGGIAVMMTAFVLAAFPAPSRAGVSVAADQTIYTMRTHRTGRQRPRWWRFFFWLPIPDSLSQGLAPA